MNTTTYALFSSPEMAEKAAGALLDHGVHAENISIVFPEGYASRNPNFSNVPMENRPYSADGDPLIDPELDRPFDSNRVGSTGFDSDGNRIPETSGHLDRDSDEERPTAEKIHDVAEKGITTTTMGDAASGAAKGAGIGLGVGTLAALAAVFVPGVGLVLGAGALAAAVAGAAGATAAGAIAGGVTGFLKDQGVPQEAAIEYNDRLRAGDAFIMVTPTDEEVDTETITGILTKYEGRPTRHSALAPESRTTSGVL